MQPIRHSTLTLTNRSPDLVIRKSVTPTNAVGGDWITYTLSVSNTGDMDATAVSITDTLPSGVTVQSVGSSAGLSVTRSSNGNNELFVIPTLAVGQSGVITLSGKVSDTVMVGEVLTNTATIAWSNAEEDTSDNQATVSTTIPCQAAMVVSNNGDSASSRLPGSLRWALPTCVMAGRSPLPMT